jgi:hypothetical protein
MGNKSDLINIYEEYKKGVVEELNIGVPQDGPSLFPSSEGQPSNNQVSNLKIEDESDEECLSCNQSPCSCAQCSSCNQLPCSCEDDDNGNTDMAKSEVFKILKSANELMNLLEKSPKIEPWQLSKLVKASDYVCNVRSSVEYGEFEKCQTDLMHGMEDIGSNMGMIMKIKDMLSGQNLAVNEEVLRQVIFNIECIKESNS